MWRVYHTGKSIEYWDTGRERERETVGKSMDRVRETRTMGGEKRSRDITKLRRKRGGRRGQIRNTWLTPVREEKRFGGKRRYKFERRKSKGRECELQRKEKWSGGQTRSIKIKQRENERMNLKSEPMRTTGCHFYTSSDNFLNVKGFSYKEKFRQ